MGGESLKNKILVPIPDSSQRIHLKMKNFVYNCGDPIHGFHVKDVLNTKDIREGPSRLQDTSRSSDDNTNIESLSTMHILSNDYNNDSTSSDDDSYENIEYVDASPPDDEIVNLEMVEIVDPEVGRINDDILLTIKDDIILKILLNVNLLVANESMH
ncbi:hypothetical protein Tco_0453974 [Tanacetum coccineum]